MKLSFCSDTMWGTNCVSELVKELSSLETSAEKWEFPYNIGVAVRCGRGIGKSFRRFEKKNNELTVDIREDDAAYRTISKNEQREKLGDLIFSYLSESVGKYPKFASQAQCTNFIENVERWMVENNWRNGNICKAHAMLSAGSNTYDVGQLLGMTLDEVEDVLLRMYSTEEPVETHNDNVRSGKAMPPI